MPGPGSPTRALAFAAISVVVHLALALSFAALWHPPPVLASEPPKPKVTETEVLPLPPDDPADKEEASLADSHTQELSGSSAGQPTPPAEQPALPTPPPIPTSPAAPAALPTPVPTPASPPEPSPTPRPPPSATPSASPSASSSSAAPGPSPAPSSSGTGSGSGDGDGGGDQPVVVAPDLVARYTKFLVKYAEGAGDWATLPKGTLATLTVTLTVDATGRLSKTQDPLAGLTDVQPFVAKSIRNTVIAPELASKLALPAAVAGEKGGVVRAGTVKITLRVELDDVDNPSGKLALRHDYDEKARRGPSVLVLESGRRVTFRVQAIEVSP